MIKDRVIYEKGKSKVYINQSINPGKRTNLYSIKREDETGDSFLGLIIWNQWWRQYVAEFEPDTRWSYECLKEISKFLEEINKNTKKKWK